MLGKETNSIALKYSWISFIQVARHVAMNYVTLKSPKGLRSEFSRFALPVFLILVDLYTKPAPLSKLHLGNDS